MLAKLQNINTFVFLRSNFSSRVAKLVGYSLGVATGCSSLTMNRIARFEQEFINLYDVISQGMGNQSIRLAVNVAFKKMSSDSSILEC